MISYKVTYNTRYLPENLQQFKKPENTMLRNFEYNWNMRSRWMP